MFDAIADAWKSSTRFNKSLMSLTSMTGTTAGGGRGYLDALILRKGLRDHLLGPWLDRLPFDQITKAELRDKLQDHASYRKWVSPIDSDSVVASLKCQSQKSATMALGLIEDCAYATSDDPAIRAAVNKRKSPEQALENVQWEETIADIKVHLDKD